MTKSTMEYVIVDREGRYVAGRGTFLEDKDHISYISYTGLTTGFTSFLHERKAIEDKTELQKMNNKYGLGKSFSVEYIDVKDIPMGKIVIENILLSKQLECKGNNNF